MLNTESAQDTTISLLPKKNEITPTHKLVPAHSQKHCSQQSKQGRTDALLHHEGPHVVLLAREGQHSP